MRVARVAKGMNGLRFLPTSIHGVLDFVGAASFAALPSLTNPSPAAAYFSYGLAAFCLVYALLTRFELGLLPLIPMKVHLLMDIAWGLLAIGVAIALATEPSAWRAATAVLGLVGVVAFFITKEEPTKAGMFDKGRRVIGA